MHNHVFKPHHINATEEDLAGNNGIGRYILLPGSDGRAKEIASRFENVKIKQHHREHNLYLGTLKFKNKKIDVATVATGMGCPSTEIIVHELFHLGGKRFLRVGTAGTLQPGTVHIGDVINVHASIRDEDTTRTYAPVEFPAVASLEMVSSIILASENIEWREDSHLHTGIVHCKSSLYARELAAGPRASENHHYLNLISQSGALATEMETATLFIQSQLYNYQSMQEGEGPEHRVLAGAILGVIGSTDYFADTTESHTAILQSIDLSLETIKILAAQEGMV